MVERATELDWPNRFRIVPRDGGYGVQLLWWRHAVMEWIDHGPRYDMQNVASGKPVWFSTSDEARAYIQSQLPADPAAILPTVVDRATTSPWKTLTSPRKRKSPTS